MTFLAPIMFAGAAAVSIPIALHFFYRARYRPLPWAPMKFLKEAVEQTSRRVKFQEWILLALRCLASDRLPALFAQFRQGFDFVIVDSSPVLLVADALQLGQQVDRVIFSVLCDVSRLPRVAAAQHRLAMLGIPTLGAVVLGTSEEADIPRYHYPVPAGV